MSLTKNEEIEVVVENINENFEGFSFVDGNKIIVLEVLKDEKVLVKIVKVGKNVSFAKLIKVISPHKERALSNDPLLDVSHISYNHLLDLKRGFLEDSFDCKIDIVPSILEGCRNKLFFPAQVIDSKFVFGLYKKRSHNIIPYNFDSKLISDEMNEILKSVSTLINRELSPFKRNIKGVYLRGENRKYQLGFQLDDCESYNKILSKLDFGDMVKSLFVYKRVEGNSILVNDPIFLKGEDFIELSVKGKSYKLRPESFFQLNSYIIEKIIEDIVTYFEDKTLSVVNDFYSGCGVLSNYFENYGVRKLYEKSIHSFKYLEKSPKLELVTGDLYKVKQKVIEDSIFIFDPPRKGIGQNCIDLVLESKPKYILYLSCNYKTQKRDIDHLLDYYSIDFIRGYDMFPYTKHLESMVILKRKI
ncbi:MAG: hypothetical protein CR982_06835 [Candidatus Cloacimonadota bacterium]|nr:MAG: hypothetical protein CR982_06835 [Candidatus Cloacimonadota bacterium]PIE77801.1 MAG: hypothetical protein CSA15_10930 [Candidatus Delongbacteria bacterium]